MALHKLRGVGLCGLAACVPRDKFFVNDYPHLSDSEKKDFTKYVGVESKRYSGGKLTTADLCFHAAQKLIGDLGWEKSEIGLVILVTQTPDYNLPSSAILLQDRLGLCKSCLAFDVNLGCSGWVYGLSIASGMMQSLGLDKALLLTGETSVIAEFENKSTFPLMGDAGTATALTRGDGGEMIFDLHTDGSGHGAIIASNSGARFLSNPEGKSEYSHHVSLDGQKVLEFCLREVLPSVRAVMEAAGNAKVDDVDYFVFHQANRIINESLRRKLGIPVEKYPYSIKDFGNTSSASIPLGVVTQIGEDLRTKELTLLGSGFGVGLSWGSVYLKTRNVVCPELIEI